jgi:anaerobic selenocysteine-containing dehydrogenase
MSSSTVPSICRSCLAFCPVLVTVEDGRVVKVAGDPHAEEYDGYTCPKGRALPEQINSPDRLLTSMKRQADGSFSPVASDAAVQEIALKLRGIIDQHGPRAVAIYLGNGTVQHQFGALMGLSFLQAIGSPMFFSPSTIDKPAEKISMAMHGYWMAGGQSFEESDTWMLVGANPIIAKSNGLPYNNPGMRLKEAVEHGLKLIVVDPRRTDCARRAHVHLQARPGEDPTLLAGFIHIVIAERLTDKAFIDANVAGFETLKAAVAAFTPEYVADRAGVAVADLLEAARTFGRAKRGMAVCATGPSFSLRGNLAFYLAHCLNTICGRWAKAGERAVFPNVLLPAFTPKAQPLPPYSIYGKETMRTMGLRETTAGMPTAALADEILLEGEGQVRALICIGGNPISAWPDQRKAEKALRSLDLLVSLDIMFSATAKLAHYVVAPPMPLEQPALTYQAESMKYYGATRGFQNCWAQYTPAAVATPPGSDLLEEHDFFFRIAQALGLSLNWTNYHGMGKFIESPTQIVPLDMARVPSVDEMFAIATSNSRVPLDEVKRHPHGKRFDIDIKVAPRDADCSARLEAADPTMMQELAEVRAEDYRANRQDAAFPFSMVCRRANNSMNSIGTNTPSLLRGKAYNPLHMHPSDMALQGLQDGNVVAVASRYDTILGVVEADDTLRPGVVAMTHGFGAQGEAAERDPFLAGSNVNLLMHADEYDPVSGIPRMSALPVSVVPHAIAAAA